MGLTADIDITSRALQELKGQLTRVTSGGGAQPTPDLLTAVADDCPEAVIITNDAAEIRMVNGAAARLTSTSTRALQALTIWDVTHPQSQGEFDVLWREFLRSGRQRGSFAVQSGDGSAVNVAYCAEANVLPAVHVFVLRRAS